MKEFSKLVKDAPVSAFDTYFHQTYGVTGRFETRGAVYGEPPLEGAPSATPCRTYEWKTPIELKDVVTVGNESFTVKLPSTQKVALCKLTPTKSIIIVKGEFSLPEKLPSFPPHKTRCVHLNLKDKSTFNYGWVYQEEKQAFPQYGETVGQAMNCLSNMDIPKGAGTNDVMGLVTQMTKQMNADIRFDIFDHELLYYAIPPEESARILGI